MNIIEFIKRIVLGKLQTIFIGFLICVFTYAILSMFGVVDRKEILYPTLFFLAFVYGFFFK